jgi:hypothetical protein
MAMLTSVIGHTICGSRNAAINLSTIQ